jgi:hypothetical protein
LDARQAGRVGASGALANGMSHGGPNAAQGRSDFAALIEASRTQMTRDVELDSRRPDAGSGVA